MERSEQAWLEKQRAEREEEFAPPSFYYDTPPAKNKPDKGRTNKIKSATASENVGSGSEMESVVEKQLSQIRKNVELESSRTLESVEDTEMTDTYKSFTNNSEGGNKTEWTHPAFTDNVASRFSAPVQSFPLESSIFSAPVPNINVPPPNFNVLPPNYQFSAQTVSVPPPNLNVPPPTLSMVPPPNLSMPPTNFCQTFPENMSQIREVSCNTTATNSYVSTGLNNSDQAGLNTVHPIGEGKKKFVPKMDIIDTRLMDSENS